MTLPSRERIEELRAMAAETVRIRDKGRGHGASARAQRSALNARLSCDDLLALLDAAITLRRLEEWLLSAPAYDRLLEALGPHAARSDRAVNVTLFTGGHHGTTESIAAEVAAPDLLSALRAALDKAEAK